uniref:Periplasmic solute binding protein n=1 Tax=Acetithermum autotrophicum TaxID=1446466 RepID=H5SQU3_ACEAU|nr:periplasmic solute binding protein [Candidatus Acetothermum autotrophicum]
MNRRRAALVLVGIAMIGAGLGLLRVSHAQEKPVVVVTTEILGDFVRKIAEDRVELAVLIPGGMCPAHYDIRPSDVAAVARAALVLHHGFEPWMENLVKASGSKALVVKTGDDWNVPPNAIQQVGIVLEALAKILPKDAQILQQNAVAFQKRIEELAGRLLARAQQLNVQEAKVISQAFQAKFVSWLGFHVVGTYPPPERVSAQLFLQLVQLGREQKVALVVDNLQSGVGVGARLAFEIGAVSVVLTNFPGAVPNTRDYLEVIAHNGTQMFEALESYRRRP